MPGTTESRPTSGSTRAPGHDDTGDPDLSRTGQVRAEDLKATLAAFPVQAIFISAYRRTRQTADPTAAMLHLTPIAIAAHGDPGAQATAIASALQRTTGRLAQLAPALQLMRVVRCRASRILPGAAMHSRALCLASLLVGLACSDSAGPSDQTPCVANVTVSVSSGTNPSISWSPACRLFLVLVEGAQGDEWGAISDGTNAIATPVRYGVVPAGATELTPPTALSVGTQYTVFVYRWVGPGQQDGTLIGQRVFTP